MGGVAGIWVPSSVGLYVDWRHNDLVSTHVRFVDSALVLGSTWNTLGLGARISPFQGTLFLHAAGIHEKHKMPSHYSYSGTFSFLGGEASIGNAWNLGRLHLSMEWLGLTQEFFRLSSSLKENKKRPLPIKEPAQPAGEANITPATEPESARLAPRTGGYLFRLSLGFSF